MRTNHVNRFAIWYQQLNFNSHPNNLFLLVIRENTPKLGKDGIEKTMKDM
jgi:hypothetical protein